MGEPPRNIGHIRAQTRIKVQFETSGVFRRVRE